MVDCPMSFKSQLQLPVSPKIQSCTNAPPLPFIDVTFDRNMDTGVLPANASFEIINDGVPETPTATAWQSSTVLRVNFTGNVTVSAVFRYIVVDTNLRDTNGLIAVPIQECQAFP